MQISTPDSGNRQELLTPKRIDELCQDYIGKLQNEGFVNQNPYHNIEHIRDVVLLCEEFCGKIEFDNIDQKNRTMLTTKCAAWFHDIYHSGRKGVEAEQINISVAITTFTTFADNTPEIDALGNTFRSDVIRIIRSTTQPYIKGFNEVLTNIDEQIVRDSDNLSVWAIKLNSSERNEWIEKVAGLVDEMYPDDRKISLADSAQLKIENIGLYFTRLYKLEIGFLKILKEGILKIYTKPAQEFFDTNYPIIMVQLDQSLKAAQGFFPDATGLQSFKISLT